MAHTASMKIIITTQVLERALRMQAHVPLHTDSLLQTTEKEKNPTTQTRSNTSIPMFPLVVQVKPAQEITYTYRSSLNISVIPGYNFIITETNPNTTATGFPKAYISVSEIGWYTRGLTIWANAQERHGVSLGLELHPSELIAIGLQITISAPLSSIKATNADISTRLTTLTETLRRMQ